MKTDRRDAAIDVLRQAVAGRLPRAVGRSAVLHLLAESDEPIAGAPPAAAPDYDAALDDALTRLPERLAASEEARRRARESAARLDAIGRVSPSEARARAAGLAADERRGVVEELVHLADETALDEPAHAIVLAGVAVSAAESARPDTGDRPGHDLRATARRALAEAAYRGGDLMAAEGALAEARRLARLGTHDPALRAELLRLEAEIRSDQSRFAEARRLAERSVRLFRRAADHRREARGRVSLALKLAYEGRLAEAMTETERALAMVDAERDGRWVLAAEFNRAYWQNKAGDPAPARAALPRLAELAARHGRALDRVRVDWLTASVATNEGDLARAAELYRQVLARCLELETIYDSATVALELAVVLLELDRADEVLPLADMVAPIFKAQGVEPEAAAAVMLAAESLRRGIAAREVLHALVAARSGARGAR